MREFSVCVFLLFCVKAISRIKEVLQLGPLPLGSPNTVNPVSDRGMNLELEINMSERNLKSSGVVRASSFVYLWWSRTRGSYLGLRRD